ncbi:CD48 antigen [Anabarilius grahami]|uniref:CD48 antigen n=1 Tax=Anabarilius grahami TaxID=495550 RepID=A0A3N0XL73_ANAGA|nr:CD48 antigen [Anabarilius grahami]
MKAVGDQVSFRPDNFVPPVTSIIWKHINPGITVKAIEWDEGEILIPNPRFRGITTVDEKTGQITITNLKVEHSGVYTIDINSKEQQQRFTLTVMKRVPKPVIKTQKIKDNPDVVYLICEYSETIIWRNSAGETLKGSKHDPKGETLVVKYEGNRENFYTCTLKNAVSEETSDPLYERDLGEDVIKAVGDQVSFHPNKFPDVHSVTSIIWKHRSSSGTIVKVIEWDEGEIIIPNPRFRDITTVDEKTGQITITNLKVEHSGVYTIDIDSKEQKQKFTLTVMERVPKPVIEVEMIEDNPDVVYLRCEYSEMIIWKNSAGKTLKGSKLHPTGQFITVKNKGNLVNFYTCTLMNAVSEETSDPLYERDLFNDVSSKELLGILITVTIIQIIIISFHFVQYKVSPEFLSSLTFVTIIVFITTEALSDEYVMKAVGDRVSFRPDNFVPPVTSIIWKHTNTDGFINKAIEWDEGEILIPNPRFRDITIVDEMTGQITIINLNYSHSGVYTIDINSKEQQQRFTLTVMKRVPKPVIKIEPTDNPDVVYLRCEYSEPIIWKNSTGETLPGSKIFPKGESITVKNEGNPEKFYTCSLDNGSSKETSDPVYERDLFEGEGVKKAVGDQVSFSPDKFIPPVTSIIWKHTNTDGITVKVIEWDDGDILIPNPRFRDITTVDEKTGQITISNLTVEHSGVYTIEINSKEQQQRFTLTVMGEDVKKAVGDQVSFRPDTFIPPVTSIIWKHINTDGTVNKVIQWDGDSIVPNQRFQGITTLDEKTGQITITNLKVQHSGVYTIEINSKEQQQRFTLTVMGEDVKKAVGDQVSFCPDTFPDVHSLTSIIWKHRSSSGILVKAIKWDEGEILIPNPRFRDITTVDEMTGQITITNLKVEHSGVYTIYINSKEQQQRFNMTVMERVPEPEKSEVYPDVVHLRCEYSDKTKKSTREELKCSAQHLTGQSITVKTEGNPENFYTCTLDKSTSKETSDPV